MSEEKTMIEEYHIACIAKIRDRLYSEKRMTGDEMRDAAQILDEIVTLLREVIKKETSND